MLDRKETERRSNKSPQATTGHFPSAGTSSVPAKKFIADDQLFV
jgi:hypothetical protein